MSKERLPLRKIEIAEYNTSHRDDPSFGIKVQIHVHHSGTGTPVFTQELGIQLLYAQSLVKYIVDWCLQPRDADSLAEAIMLEGAETDEKDSSDRSSDGVRWVDITPDGRRLIRPDPVDGRQVGQADEEADGQPDGGGACPGDGRRDDEESDAEHDRGH
jgi:hypothetical protein